MPLVFFSRCPENIQSLRAGLLTYASSLERLPVFTVALCSSSAFTVVAAVEALHLASLLRQLGCRPESIQLYVHENAGFNGFSSYPHNGSDYSKSLPCCQGGARGVQTQLFCRKAFFRALTPAAFPPRRRISPPFRRSPPGSPHVPEYRPSPWAPCRRGARSDWCRR